MSEDTELESFKQSIDLRQFAASIGYQIDRRDSWRGSTVMRRGDDKIVVKRNGNGHYVYFSVKDDDDNDNGTIIDFAQRRRKLNLGAVRKELRPWVNRAPSSLPLFPKLEPTTKDRMQVESAYRRMVVAPCHPYLEQERCLSAAVLSSPRFADRVRSDSRGNAVMPHFDTDGLCGYEIKNRGFTGFAAGGEKGLWISHTRPEDHRLVVAESAIDALSYAALFPDLEDKTRYASLGGKPNFRQPGLLKATIDRMATGSEIVAAFDADDAGRGLVEMVRVAVESVAGETKRSDLVFRAHLPSEGKDWNDVLCKRLVSSFPIALPDDLNLD